MLGLSAILGPDASWDLRNYHLYNAFALLQKPDWLDLVPAQRQTFHPPLVDLPSYWLRIRLNHWPRLLDMLLAVPSAAAVVLAWAIGRTVQRDDGTWGQLSLLLALLLGATGAAGLPTTGTSMSEMPAGCFTLAGLLVLLRGIDSALPRRSAFAAGLLFGIAIGLKPTEATFLPAAIVALLVCSRDMIAKRCGIVAIVCLGAGAGAILTVGLWWLHLVRLTGSPVFPYMNGLFRSPLFPPIPLSDDRFIPHGIARSLFQPFFWSLRPSYDVCELAVRDPRFALAWIATLACLLQWAWRRPVDRRPLFLLVFGIASVVLWQRQSSILRYLAPLELLSGLVLLIALSPLRRLHGSVPPALLCAVLCACAGMTIYPDWGRAHPADTAARVLLPFLPPGTMVLLLTDDPMAYVAAFADPRVRFVGVNNNLLRFGPDSAIARRVQAAVRTQDGPIWGLEVPGTPDPAASVLAGYGLHRQQPCVPVRTNLESDGLRLCPLSR